MGLTYGSFESFFFHYHNCFLTHFLWLNTQPQKKTKQNKKTNHEAVVVVEMNKPMETVEYLQR